MQPLSIRLTGTPSDDLPEVVATGTTDGRAYRLAGSCLLISSGWRASIILRNPSRQ